MEAVYYHAAHHFNDSLGAVDTRVVVLLQSVLQRLEGLLQHGRVKPVTASLTNAGAPVERHALLQQYSEPSQLSYPACKCINLLDAFLCGTTEDAAYDIRRCVTLILKRSTNLTDDPFSVGEPVSIASWRDPIPLLRTLRMMRI